MPAETVSQLKHARFCTMKRDLTVIINDVYHMVLSCGRYKAPSDLLRARSEWL